ncbi:hypothetical protein A0128_08080 [Leptospira tipperaryensis]|uniref:Uncharacterized protein n=1 Tax=Leptospira tipperaryensis TaxID=2564040 RepID=A0A1D7UW79_9LEPT|nr:hypothetical protein A0128_08080 [Leptospira tipperaryensis]
MTFAVAPVYCDIPIQNRFGKGPRNFCVKRTNKIRTVLFQRKRTFTNEAFKKHKVEKQYERVLTSI